ESLNHILPQEPFILAGDFNETLRIEDWTPSRHNPSPSTTALSKLCTTLNLTDPFPAHSPHTFHSHNHSARLDRFYSSLPDTHITPIQIINPHYSDHSPILCNTTHTNTIPTGPTYWKL